MNRLTCNLLLLLFLCGNLVAQDSELPPLGPRIKRLEKTLKDSDDARVRALLDSVEQSIGDAEDQLFANARNEARIQSEFDFLVASCKKWLAQIESVSDENGSLVESLADDLKDLEESWQDGTAYLAPRDELIQWIHAAEPNPIVNQTGDEEDLQTVTVKPESFEDPSVLVLSGDTSMHWKLIGNTTSVKAILLFGRRSQISGVDKVLVFPLSLDGTLRDRGDHYARTVEEQLGRSADLRMTIRDFSEPFEPGPLNREWARAAVIGQLSQLLSRIKSNANRAFAEQESDLRFPGFTVETRSFMRSSSLTEFGLSGPTTIERRRMTMKTKRGAIGLNMWNYTEVGNDAYALTFHGQLSKRGDNDGDWIDVKSPPGTNRLEFRSIAHDPKRNRLVLLDAKGNLRELDLQESKWKSLGSGMSEIFGLVYQASTDHIVALQQTPRTEPFLEKKTTLLFLDPDGKPIRQVESDFTDTIQNMVERTYNEIHLTEKYLIATQPPATSFRHPLRNVIRVFELETGKLLYEHMLPKTNSTEDGPPVRGRQVNNNTYARLQQRLSDAALAIERAKRLAPKAAEQLDQQWNELSDPLGYAVQPRKEPVIYWMRTFRDRVPKIRFTDTSGPVILAISSFNVREWQFELDEGVDIQEVIFVGLNPPKLVGLPADVKVTRSTESLSGNERQPSYQKSVISKHVQSPKIKFATEREFNYFQVVPPFVVIGPRNTDQAVGSAIRALDNLVLDAAKLSGTSPISETFRFAYLYEGEKKGAFYITECDFRGPLMQTQRRLHTAPAERSRNTVAYAGRGRMFVRLGSQLDEVRLTDTSYESTPIAQLPNRAITHLIFDTRKQRLLRIERGTQTNLFVHDRKDPQPIEIERFKDRLSTRVAWCLDEEKRRLFAIVRTQLGINEIHEVSMTGKLVRKLRLPTPIDTQQHPSDHLFSAACDGKNIFLVMRAMQGLQGTKIHVLDIQSLKTVYQGDFQAHVPRENISHDRFMLLWGKLRDAQDNDEADAIMWELAAGGKDTIRRIERFAGGVEGLTRKQVDALVKQMDANTYAERKEAFEKMRMGATQHAEYLEGIVGDLSAEQRFQIRRLLRKWKQSDNFGDRIQKIVQRAGEQ